MRFTHPKKSGSVAWMRPQFGSAAIILRRCRSGGGGLSRPRGRSLEWVPVRSMTSTGAPSKGLHPGESPMSEFRVRFEAAEGKGYLAQLSDADGKPGVTVPFTPFLTEDDY